MRNVVLSIVLAVWFPAFAAADSSQLGGSPARNNAPETGALPTEWNIGGFDWRTGDWRPGGAENILWVARLGSQTYGTPIVAGGRIFVATNNGTGYVRRYPPDVDLGCLLCFRQEDGRFGWQLSREKLPQGRALDWPDQGIVSSPLVEGDRAWIVTNRGEVVCVDVDGFYNHRNTGPYRDEPSEDHREADIVWIYDMIGELGVQPHNMSSCSVTAAGDLLLVNTSNGVDESHDTIPAPDAPSFIALDKYTGELVWADASPGENILHGQWGSPAFAVLGGVPQAVFPGGDGWLYSFRAERTADGRPELLWKFDTNRKTARWGGGGMGERNNLIATPVIHDGLVYIAGGQDPEHGEGPSILWCIDPTRRGDVSPELVFDADGNPLPPRRVQNCDPDAGETTRPNPNSAVVWNYTGADVEGRRSFEETMHRTISMAAIRDGLLVIPDFAGLIHCVDVKTGEVHWTHDTLASIWGSPLIADGKIYVGDEDGDVTVFRLSPEKEILATNNMADSIYSSPVAVGNIIYISTRRYLVAIGETAEGE